MATDTGRTVPALLQRGEWLTLPRRRTVLFPIHTQTYLSRLRLVYELTRTDLRVQHVFTVPPHAFGQGMQRSLERLGINPVPWQDATAHEFDLAVVAGSQSAHELRAPVIRLSHGAGHSKLLRRPDHRSGTGSLPVDEQRPPAMLSRDHLTRDGQVVPAAVAVPHQQDIDTLRRWCPEALPVTTVVGDPAHDRMLVSVPRRSEYRRALGLGEEDRLVVLTSTWGPDSVFEQLDSLLPRLLTELPGTFRTVVLTHPNVYAGHGEWQVRGWLAAARERGALVAPPLEQFESLLSAADWIIGDHGSVTVYGALAGVPVLTTPAFSPSIAANSAAAALARRAPSVSPLRPLLPQLQYAAEAYRPDALREVTARITTAPGEFNHRMRALMYRVLGLGEPAHRPSTAAAPVPRPVDDWCVDSAGGAAA